MHTRRPSQLPLVAALVLAETQMRPNHASLRPRRPFGFRTPFSSAEVLESRVLPAVTLLMDYTFDTTGFFNDPRARRAMESVAAELGSRLMDRMDPLRQGDYLVYDPSRFQGFNFTETFARFSVAADTLRIFAAGNDDMGPPNNGILGAAIANENSAIRRYDPAKDWAPYAISIGFGTTWDWDFDGTNTDPNAFDFRSTARHELLHALGIGQAPAWFALSSNGRFTGNAARAANGGVYPEISTGIDGGVHFNQGEFSLMQPFDDGTFFRPTALDWAALKDIGWNVQMPGILPDLVSRSADGTWWLSSNAGEVSQPYDFGRWDESLGWRDVGAGDFDGDGLTDYVGRTAAGDWFVGINTSNEFQNTHFGTWSPIAWRDVKFADFNNDGKTDVAGRAQNGAWWVGISDGTQFTTTLWDVWDGIAGWRDVHAADINGDRFTDIIGRTAGGSWWVGLSDGTGFTARNIGFWNEAADWRDVRVADLNLDGRADVVGRTAAGSIWVGFTSASLSLVNRLFGGWAGNAGWRDVAVGDFDGDARPDLIGRTAAGQWFVGVNNGTSFVNAPFGRWVESAGWRDVMFNDFNGDGRRDVLARTSTGQWWLGANNGSQFVFQQYGQWNEALGWRFVAASKDFVPADRPDAAASGAALTSSSSGSLTTSFHPASAESASPQASTAAFAPTPPSAQNLVLSRSVTDEERSGDRSIGTVAASVGSHAPVSTALENVFADAVLLDALAAA